MKLIFAGKGWEDYLYWQDVDPKLARKINALIKDCVRHPFEGIGKPEALRGNYSGFWSRRITQEHRMVYRVVDEALEIAQCRFHYED